MPKQFDGVKCVLCLVRESSPSSEHVFPKWFLRLFPADAGPYLWYVNGEPVRKRDGAPRKTTSISPVKLPACIDCNGELDRRFEKPAVKPVRSLAKTDFRLALRPSDAQAVALWLLKTSLLLAHPAAVYPGISPSKWIDAPQSFYSWLINQASPPTGFSMWIHRAAGPPASATRHIPLPTVVADAGVIEFRCMQVRFGPLDVSLVYHPCWAIKHPLEAEGRAVRVWPCDGSGVDLTNLPEVDSRDTCWLKGPKLMFRPGSYGSVALPPLSPELDLLFPQSLLSDYIKGGSW